MSVYMCGLLLEGPEIKLEAGVSFAVSVTPNIIFQHVDSFSVATGIEDALSVQNFWIDGDEAWDVIDRPMPWKVFKEMVRYHDITRGFVRQLIRRKGFRLMQVRLMLCTSRDLDVPVPCACTVVAANP